MAAGFYFWDFYLDHCWSTGAKHSRYLVELHHRRAGGRCRVYFWQIAPLLNLLHCSWYTEPGTVYYWSVPTTPGIPGATPGISHIGHKVSALHHLQLECGIAVSPRASITRFRQMVGGQDDQRYRGDTRDTPLPPQTQKDKLG